MGILNLTIATMEFCYNKIISIKDRDLKIKDEIIKIKKSYKNYTGNGESIGIEYKKD